MEVVRNENKVEGFREAASFLSVLLSSLYAPLTVTYNNRGVGGLVRENIEGTAKVSFLSLGRLGLLNLDGLILLSLGGLIRLNIILLGLGLLLGLV